MFGNKKPTAAETAQAASEEAAAQEQVKVLSQSRLENLPLRDRLAVELYIHTQFDQEDSIEAADEFIELLARNQ